MSQAQKDQLKRMGMDPEMMERSMKMMQENPAVMASAQKMMEKVKLKNEHKEVQYFQNVSSASCFLQMTPQELLESSKKAQEQMSKMTPEQLEAAVESGLTDIPFVLFLTFHYFIFSGAGYVNCEPC